MADATRTWPQRLRKLRPRSRLRVAPDLPEPAVPRVVQLVEAVLDERETSAQRAAAEQVVTMHRARDETGRRRSLEVLAAEFGTDPHEIDAAAAALRTAKGEAERVAAERALRCAVVPRVSALLHVISGLPNGVRFLVELRASVLWQDLRQRLKGARRYCACFHPALLDEPIVFVEVAFTDEVPDDLGRLLEHDGDIEHAKCAVFYSITSCEAGLAGIQLGNELIKHVVEEIRRTHEGVRTFATLSPVPSLRAWFLRQLRHGRLPRAEAALVESAAPTLLAATGADRIEESLDDDARRALLSAAARYLTTPVDGRVPDPVANFHLGNGASLDRINWMANDADYGRAESFGIMVNYRYHRPDIARFANAYVIEGQVHTATQVRALVVD